MDQRRSSTRIRRRLRKQPKLRRVEVATGSALPRIVVPEMGRRRRKRNKKQRARISGLWRPGAIKQVITSARWLSLTLLVICIACLVLVGQDDTFFLKLVPVEGAQTIPASEVLAASGLVDNHVFAVDPNEAAANIDQLPGVITATVTLAWPNEVAIRIGEEGPIAVWEQAGDQFWIDESGRLTKARAETTSLLVIRSESEGPADETTFVSSDVLDGALQLRALRPNIDVLYFRAGSGLSYQDGRGWRVYFGTGTDMSQKLVVYETIVDDLQGRGIVPAYISVTNQTRPYYGFAPGQTAQDVD